MRVLIFHGYLLDGTGSNVYNARLAAALVSLGHEVHLLCQERHPDRYPFIDAAGDWDDGSLAVRFLGESGQAACCTVYRPDIGGLLPVYVADRYEGVQARTFADCSDQQLARYVEDNVAAVGEVAALIEPQVVLANHLVMGPVIVARALGAGMPYAVKIHGSALEYTVKPDRARFGDIARDGLAPARGILVGSRHTAISLWQTLADPGLERRTRLGPPGVDVERFAPREPSAAAAALGALSRRLRAQAGSAPANGGGDAFTRDAQAAGRALEGVDSQSDRLVAFVGKLIVSKGVDLLLASWPLVLGSQPRARLAVVGFGAYRDALERLWGALAAGDLGQGLAIGRQGRALEGDGAGERPLGHLVAFLDGLQGERREWYLAAVRGRADSVLFTGRLEHEELAELLPACEALVVPSTFPESFGMVAAEAAACGVFPISAAHSGLAEVSAALAGEIPAQAAGWLSFPVDDGVVDALAGCVVGWLGADERLRARTREGLVSAVGRRWSWAQVASGVLAAAAGELDRLARP